MALHQKESGSRHSYLTCVQFSFPASVGPMCEAEVKSLVDPGRNPLKTRASFEDSIEFEFIYF